MTISGVVLMGQRIATAVATYGTLSRLKLKESLIDPNGAANFTPSQADAFVAQYDLVDQLPNVAFNGFSAAVFLDKQTGRHVIAMRGTEVPVFPSQTWQDLVVTDVLSIGGNGFANNQAVEMIRYYKRLITTGGQAVQYTEQEKWQLFAIKNSLLLPLASVVPVLSVSLAAQFLAFKDELAADRGVSPPPGSATASVLSATEKVDATGSGNALDNVLTGNSANNTLTGGAGNDTIDGGSGNDTMIGGAGDDTYVVNATGDIVTEGPAEGSDTIRSSVTLTLGSHVENLVLLGTSAVSGTGNALDNVLTGNAANNTLTGGAGNDTLIGGGGTDTLRGGSGNDTYVVDSSADVATENANEGTDTVQASVTWTLGSNLENLELSGVSAINGTGNTLNNVLRGNAGANVLSGGAGADTLSGGAGADTLIGGTGADTYAFARGDGIDTIQENDATGGVLDFIVFGAGISVVDVAFSRSGNDLNATVSGGADRLVVKDWYLGAAYQVERIQFADGTVLTNSQVQSQAASSPAMVMPMSVELVGVLALGSSDVETGPVL